MPVSHPPPWTIRQPPTAHPAAAAPTHEMHLSGSGGRLQANLPRHTVTTHDSIGTCPLPRTGTHPPTHPPCGATTSTQQPSTCCQSICEADLPFGATPSLELMADSCTPTLPGCVGYGVPVKVLLPPPPHPFRPGADTTPRCCMLLVHRCTRGRLLRQGAANPQPSQHLSMHSRKMGAPSCRPALQATLLQPQQQRLHTWKHCTKT